MRAINAIGEKLLGELGMKWMVICDTTVSPDTQHRSGAECAVRSGQRALGIKSWPSYKPEASGFASKTTEIVRGFAFETG